MQDTIIDNLERIVRGCCEAAGATCSLKYEKGYPAVKNSAVETEMAAESLRAIVGQHKVIELDPLMGGEDFAYYLEKVPGSFLYAGGGNVEKGIVYGHHHPKFDVDEDSILFTAKGMLTVALDYLKMDGRYAGG